MKIAVDYDGTFTLNPVAFSRVIRVLKQTGADIRIVTSRNTNGDNEELEGVSKFLEIPVVYCSGQQKKTVCQGLGWVPDIWVDNEAHTIPHNSELVSASNDCYRYGKHICETVIKANRHVKNFYRRRTSP